MKDGQINIENIGEHGGGKRCDEMLGIKLIEKM